MCTTVIRRRGVYWPTIGLGEYAADTGEDGLVWFMLYISYIYNILCISHTCVPVSVVYHSCLSRFVNLLYIISHTVVYLSKYIYI